MHSPIPMCCVCKNKEKKIVDKNCILLFRTTKIITKNYIEKRFGENQLRNVLNIYIYILSNIEKFASPLFTRKLIRFNIHKL